MRRSHLISLGVLALLIVLPQATHAASTSFFGPIIPTSGQCVCAGSAPDWGCVLQLIQNVMNFIVTLATVGITIFIALAGFSYMSSGGNPEKRTQANKQIMNAVIGLLIVLCAYLLVDSLMKVLYNQNSGFGPWNSILVGNGNDYCIVEHNPPGLGTAVVQVANVEANKSGGTPTTGGAVQGGVCAVQSSGSCSTANLTIFGSVASQASQICNAESHGNASIKSGTDKLGDGTPYSIGIFQINLTANSVGGLPCPSAFSKQGCTVKSCGPGTGVVVTNASLYNQCVQAADNPQTNAAAAYQIYQKGNKRGGGNSWNPWGTAQQCGLRN